MPANLKDLRSRIKSVKNTQQITKAMKLVSSAKFGRAQQAVLQSRFYSKSISMVASDLVSAALAQKTGPKAALEQFPLLKENDSKKALVLILSSERGLCGGYNANIAKQAVRTIDELSSNGFECHVVFIGKKAQQILSKKNFSEYKTKIINLDEFCSSHSDFESSKTLKLIATSFEKPTHAAVLRISKLALELFEQGKIGKFVCVYSKFLSALAQEPIDKTLLPLKTSKELNESEALLPKSAVVSPEVSTLRQAKFEPSLEILVNSVLPRFVSTLLFQGFLESVASEHGARMTAMDNATRNGRDMEKKLQITYQRARQAAITNELIEIISGAEAI
jgi:F-type H+-transporting ATPase subunit gamma